MKKVILIILDSLGIGAMQDHARFGDHEPHTLQSLYKNCPQIGYPNLEKMGMKRLCGLPDETAIMPGTYYGRLAESSNGKDTTVGHWEMCGIITQTPLATYPQGFPRQMLQPFLDYLQCDILGNEAASGTEIIERLGAEHMASGRPIVYTSADSVLQIAAHEDIIGLERLYEICAKARELYNEPPYQVGRIIARPFTGTPGNFVRDNASRRDFALDPPEPHLLTLLQKQGRDVWAVGKIDDIFAHSGITHAVHTKDNMDGVDQTINCYQKLQQGLVFSNLVDFDAKYGHRRDTYGYAQALAEFDRRVPDIIQAMDQETMLIIAADHGCDPEAPGTDHTREYVPWLVYSPTFKGQGYIPQGKCFGDIGATIAAYLGVDYDLPGTSRLEIFK